MSAKQVPGGPPGLAEGKSRGNGYFMFRPESWERGRGWPNWRGAKSCPFFSVHWQVNTYPSRNGVVKDDTHNVRLHVESTKHADLPELNDLKAEVIEALRRREVEQAVLASGYNYQRPTWHDDVRGEYCTEAFRVVLRPEQNTHSPQDNVLTVYEALGSIVAEVVDRFTDRIDAHFAAVRV